MCLILVFTLANCIYNVSPRCRLAFQAKVLQKLNILMVVWKLSSKSWNQRIFVERAFMTMEISCAVVPVALAFAWKATLRWLVQHLSLLLLLFIKLASWKRLPSRHAQVAKTSLIAKLSFLSKLLAIELVVLWQIGFSIFMIKVTECPFPFNENGDEAIFFKNSPSNLE